MWANCDCFEETSGYTTSCCVVAALGMECRSLAGFVEWEGSDFHCVEAVQGKSGSTGRKDYTNRKKDSPGWWSAFLFHVFYQMNPDATG